LVIDVNVVDKVFWMTASQRYEAEEAVVHQFRGAVSAREVWESLRTMERLVK